MSECFPQRMCCSKKSLFVIAENWDKKLSATNSERSSIETKKPLATQINQKKEQKDSKFHQRRKRNLVLKHEVIDLLFLIKLDLLQSALLRVIIPQPTATINAMATNGLMSFYTELKRWYFLS